MQPCKVTMGLVHGSLTLNRVSQAIAVPARKKPSSSVEFRDLAPTIHAIGVNVADKPGPFTAETAVRPADRNRLGYGMPLVAG